MQFNIIFLLLILASSYVVFGQGSYEDCCLTYAAGLRRGRSGMVVKYRLQKMDGGCNIPAIVFTMRKGCVFCADPKLKWVKDLIQRIDKKPRKKPHHRLPKGGAFCK